MNILQETVIPWITTTGIKLVIALVILYVSFRVINGIAKKIIKKLTGSRSIDKTLAKTLANAAAIGLKIVVTISLVGYVGIETSGISAVIASLGVCVGLAVNGTLSNLAGGAMLLITRPFNVGDYISAQGNEGTVEDILVCSTKILTVDNKVVYLPNSALSTGTIINYSEKPERRVDLVFSVAGNDPAKVRSILLDVCADDAKVLKDPAPFARITDFGAGNGLKITLRAWCKSGDYWDVYFGLLDSIQQRFDQEKIVVPFNQLDVHMKND